MGLGLAGLDVERVVDGDARRLVEVARHHHHRLHRKELASKFG